MTQSQILLAKIKGRGNDNPIKKILSSNDIFTNIDVSQTESFEPEKSLGTEEWFHIPSYSSFKYTNPIIDQYQDTSILHDIDESDYLKAEYLCCIDNQKFYFQKVSSKSIVTKKWFEFFGDRVLNTNKPILILDDQVDAVYDKQEDALYFKNLSKVASIFKGIDNLYREATEEETVMFLQHDFILLAEGYGASAVKKNNRKRIALAADTLTTLSADEKRQIFHYIREYCPHLCVSNEEKFNIANEKDLKKLLYGIERRYYKKAVTGEAVMATSVEPLLR